MRTVYRAGLRHPAAREFQNVGPDSDGASGHAETNAGGEPTMSSFASRERLLATTIFLGIMAVQIAPAVAQQEAPPDFSSNNVGWVGLNGGGPFFEPVPGACRPSPRIPLIPSFPTASAGSRPTGLPISAIRT
jgi:hypothetical protein